MALRIDISVDRGRNEGMRATVTRGFAYLFAQSVGAKLLNLVGQWLLAWLLVPADFGLAGLGLTVLAFADVVQRSGLKDVLINRQKRLRLWVGPALALNLALGVGAAGVIAAGAAPFARYVGQPAVAPILWILAAVIPLNAASTVLQAVLEARLRFRFVALVTFLAALCQTALGVLFAWRGWGPLALIAPLPLVQALRVALLWYASRPLTLAPAPRRWRYLASDSVAAFFAYGFAAIIWQGDYLLLGMFQGVERVGYYYFAFNLSLQFVLLLTGNLGAALFPALASMSTEPDRQLNAYLSVTRTIAFIGVPVCLLQATVAVPAIWLVFGPKWGPAAPLTQVLCLGMAIRIVEWTSESMLKAQGRFKTFLLLTAAHACVFSAAVGVASRFGGPLAVAVVVSALLAIFGPLRMAAALRAYGGGIREVFAILLRPMLASGAAAAVGLVTVQAIPPVTRISAVVSCIGGAVGFLVVYGALMRAAVPAEVRQTAARVRNALSWHRRPAEN